MKLFKSQIKNCETHTKNKLTKWLKSKWQEKQCNSNLSTISFFISLVFSKLDESVKLLFQ